MNTLRARTDTRQPAENALEQKKNVWFKRLAYDPFGEYGHSEHAGQAKVHKHLNNPVVKTTVIRAGKRAGKSTCAAAEGYSMLEAGGKVWVVSATLDLCKAIFNPIWKAAVDGGALKPTFKDRRRFRVEFDNGAVLLARSWGEGVDSLEAEAADLMLIDEAQKLNDEAWNLLQARTLDRNGKILMVGSEQENSEFFDDICEQAGEFADKGPEHEGRYSWRFEKWSTFDNPHISREGLEEMRGGMSETAFNALVHAERRPSYTTVFPEFNKAIHVGDVPFMEDESVTLWIDPGYNFYAVTPVQFKRETNGLEMIRVFDEVYMMQTSHQEVIAEVMSRPWWPRVKDAVIDIAALQHNPANADKRSAAEEWFDRVKFMPRSSQVGIQDGIDRTRAALRDANRQSHLIYDRRCVNSIDEYKAYRYIIPRGDERPKTDRPMDKHNHHLKSLAYGLADHYGLTGFDSWETKLDRLKQRNARPRSVGGAAAVQRHKTFGGY